MADIYFSASTVGFYNSDFSRNIPTDAVKIDESVYLAMLDGQAEGKEISPDENGKPILIDKE